MFLYTKESLDRLRQSIDLVDVLSAHISLQRAGASYKALCPFHEEKTPSFVVQRGDTHYHCFGCGAHGDAIAFLMSHVKMGFVEAIESLSERFQIPLEKVEQEAEEKGPNKFLLKKALDLASHFYHFYLLHTKEGHLALTYLYQRGISLSFIDKFQIGFAPKEGDLLHRFLRAEGHDDEVLQEAGLLAITSSGRKRDFFSDRITFPIRDALGSVIGFSCRKYKEETFGGKYINTPETALFKKSHILFGLSYCRQHIAKERKAIIVEGQLDALRLIDNGFTYTVAGQGTAFGEGHVRELLHLGVNHVFLALDGDNAGHEAMVKIGDIFQQKGVEVSIVLLPEKSDPDSFLLAYGPGAFEQLLEKKKDYLSFVFTYLTRNDKELSPSKKSEVVSMMSERIKKWEHPVMVHESLKKLASITHVPEDTIGIGPAPKMDLRGFSQRLSQIAIDPDRILETDLLRWMILVGEKEPRILEIIQKNLLRSTHFRIASCRSLYEAYQKAYEAGLPTDLLSLASSFQLDEQSIVGEIMHKKINRQKAEEGVLDTLQKILLRDWMEQREHVRVKLQQASSSEEEVQSLLKEFDEIKKNPPKVLAT